MDIILKERGHGKTMELIHLSAQTGIPIVCSNPYFVKMKAEEICLKIPDPITHKELIQMDTKPDRIYIDELGLVLKKILGCSIAGFTETV